MLYDTKWMNSNGSVRTAADVEELTAHARRVVQRSAYRTAALRADGPLVSLSPHVTVGAAEWTGAERPKVPQESMHATADETELDQDSAEPKDRWGPELPCH